MDNGFISLLHSFLRAFSFLVGFEKINNFNLSLPNCLSQRLIKVIYLFLHAKITRKLTKIPDMLTLYAIWKEISFARLTRETDNGLAELHR